MTPAQSHNKPSALQGLPLLAALCFLLASAAACSEEKHSYVHNLSTSTPTMSTANVNTFISDSGYTRYFITTPLWDIYDEAEEPFWFFPDGLELEQYDLNLNPVSNMRCDSAKYLSSKRIWRLDGNVVMINTDRDSFLTQQVFWDQARREVYSDSFVHIVRADRIIEGYGFTSNENMTRYTVNRPTGIFPVERTPGQANANSDSASASPTLRERHGAPIRASERQPEPIIFNPEAPRGLEHRDPSRIKPSQQRENSQQRKINNSL